MGVCVGRTCLQPALDAHKFVFGVFYDRHCTDSCSDGSDFVFGLSNLGRSKRPYDWFNGGPNKKQDGTIPSVDARRSCLFDADSGTAFYGAPVLECRSAHDIRLCALRFGSHCGDCVEYSFLGTQRSHFSVSE